MIRWRPAVLHLHAPVRRTGGENARRSGAARPRRCSRSALAAQVQDFSPRGTIRRRASCSRRSSSRQQRRASRIAWHYLRDAAEADEAVQDAFVKVFTHIGSFQRNLSFEVWFTRILINGCLDRQKARTRRSRWMLPVADAGAAIRTPSSAPRGRADRSPEAQLIAREWRDSLSPPSEAARPPAPLFMLCHYDDSSTRDVAEMTGLNESTVRVHLFRAMRKLRTAYGRTASWI